MWFYWLFFKGRWYKRHRKHHREPFLALTSVIINNQTINGIIMSLNLTLGQPGATGVLGLIDHVTGQPIADAVFSSQFWKGENDAIFTVTSAADGNSADIEPVAFGSGTLLVNTTATYTNSLGVKVTETKSALIGVTVAAVANSTDLVVNFTQKTA